MRIIAHLDMDAFFAAVEERDNPQFAGKPIVVGADPINGRGRGVVSTANYKAREYGIKSALPISHAWRFSQAAKSRGEPEAIFLPVDMAKYQQVSQKIMEIIRQFVPVVEQVSVDEAYLDLSFAKSYERAKVICQKIKAAIKERQNLTSSIGLGPNKLIAKIAADFQKPDGLTVIKEEKVSAFLEPLTIRVIPGIGPKTESKLNALGIKTVKDLKEMFGKDAIEDRYSRKTRWGIAMWERALGIDESPVVSVAEPAKSISEQETFQEDTLDPNLIFEKLNELCQRVITRFKPSGFKTFGTVGIAVRFADFQTVTRVRTLDVPASSLTTLKREVMKMILPFFDKRENPRVKPIRLFGVRVEKFANRYQKPVERR